MTTPAAQELLMRALKLAMRAHEQQQDKQGKPYFLHVMRVVLSDRLADDIDRTIAALHDVVEDTRNSDGQISFTLLYDAGFPKEVVHTVALLTRAVGESYDKYMGHMIDQGCIRAMRVKLADFDDHFRGIHDLKPADRKRLMPRYIKWRDLVEQELQRYEPVPTFS